MMGMFDTMDAQYPVPATLMRPPTAAEITMRQQKAANIPQGYLFSSSDDADTSTSSVAGKSQPWKLPPVVYPQISPGQVDQGLADDKVAAKNAADAKPKFYSADEPFGPNDFRSRIRGGAAPGQPQRLGGTPGEQIGKDYGMGGPTVIATADKNGKFNSFSQGPTGTGTAAPTGGIAADIANVQAQLKQWKGNGTMTGMIMTKGLRTQLATLRAQQVQQGQLGVQQRQATTQEQIAYPQIAMAMQKLGLATGGDSAYNELRAMSAAIEGRPDTTVLPNALGGANIVRNIDVATNRGASTALPGMSNIINVPEFMPRISPLQFDANDVGTRAALQKNQYPDYPR